MSNDDRANNRVVPFSPPDIDDDVCEEVCDALRSGWITTGPKVKELESKVRDYVGAGGCACLASATAALELVLRVLEIGPGDEVIVPAYTYTASASPVVHVGARVVLIDSRGDDYDLNLDACAKAITPRTKAIIPVDLGGKVCDYSAIIQLAEQHRAEFVPNGAMQERLGRIAVIADCAHSLGASRDGKMAGNWADFSTFSFHAVKNLTTAEGGAVTWPEDSCFDDEDLYKKFMLLSLHGQNKDALAKSKVGAWEYDIVEPAYKCNLTDVCASIGLSQFRRYPAMLLRRRDIIERYDAAFGPLGVRSLSHYDNGQSSGHLYIARVPGLSETERNRLIEAMGERGVTCNVHYKPLPMMTAYKKMGYSIEDFPNAYALYENEITLPLHTKLSDEDVEYVIDSFIDCLADIRGA
ncbi:MAG: DegT/DnrJ/EryC1/StrS family aminotransferase [Eggerthellaceae bacterium]|nr:DegT/DnrJ/EryC1/StrS family aminotransferase [Eggerthellaceae bacterium]